MVCCFFGHKDASSSIYHKLEETIEKLILEEGVASFLVGNQGCFDSMALKALRNMKTKYSYINYNVVLAYMPTKKEDLSFYEDGETMLPEGIESVHPKFAISWRNEWLIKKSDYVICYVTHSRGGAAKYMKLSVKNEKNIVNIALL